MDNFEEYLRQGEPNKAEKAKVWKIAIGLQQVDGLTPSDYLIATAKQNIEGDISIDEVKQLIDSYYKQHPDTVKTQNDTVKIENDTVFYLIKQNNQITATQIGERLKRSLSTVKRKIKELKHSGKIERIGSDKSGHWKIIEK
jgi:predicted HTH transcriptional regulator